MGPHQNFLERQALQWDFQGLGRVLGKVQAPDGRSSRVYCQRVGHRLRLRLSGTELRALGCVASQDLAGGHHRGGVAARSSVLQLMPRARRTRRPATSVSERLAATVWIHSGLARSDMLRSTADVVRVSRCRPCFLFETNGTWEMSRFRVEFILL